MAQTLQPVEIGRLKWQCRRGLLENDLFIERFFQRHGAALTEAHARGLQSLMALSDPDLMDLLLARKELEGEAADEESLEVLRLMRVPSRTMGNATDARVETSPP